eukprot:9285387-Pyramimonas_sp.AAC.1
MGPWLRRGSLSLSLSLSLSRAHRLEYAASLAAQVGHQGAVFHAAHCAEGHEGRLGGEHPEMAVPPSGGPPP